MKAALSVRGYVTPACALIAIVALWQVLGKSLLSAVLPPPTSVVSEVWNNWAIYPPNITATVSEAARGWLFGNAAAVVVGCLFVTIPSLEAALLRIAITSYCLPIIAIGPILQIAFDGDEPKVIMAALSVFFTTLLGTMLGLRSADRTNLELIHVYGGNRWTALRLVGLPFALPSILVALQIAIPAALLGAIIGEYLGGTHGLGVAMINAEQTFDLPRMWGFELVTAGLAIVGWLAGALICRLATPWAAERRVDVAAFASAAGKLSPSRGAALAGFARDGAFMLVSLGLALGLWQFFIWLFRLDHYFAKTPLDVWEYLSYGSQSAGNRREIWSNLQVTFGDALIGYAIGTLLAVATAMACVLSKVVERAVLPALITVRVIPLLSLTPLIVLVFGRGMAAVAVITGIITFFPTVLNVIQGLRSVPRDILDVMTALNAKPFTTMIKVRFMYALPALCASARIAAPGALMAAVVAEWLVTGEGLGSLMLSAAASSRYATLWASVAVVTLLAVLWYAAVGLTEAIVNSAGRPWNPSAGRSPDG